MLFGNILSLLTVCYTHLGCFPLKHPYDNAMKLLPESPAKIKVIFRIYTRQNKYYSDRLTPSSKKIRSSKFDGSRPTKFIIHGYRDKGLSAWVKKMRLAILKQEDANVIAVDWGKGANRAVYYQAAANTRVVGATIARLIKALKKYGKTSYGKMHLIGHSLGAHTAGYAGERIKGLGRITGLDPANAAFEGKDRRVRLDDTDAKFVDVIHTDGKPFTTIGFGIQQRVGHVDFYPNGGRNQPGCSKQRGKHMFSLFSGKFTDFAKGIACSHGRAVNLFTESITSSCRFTAYPCKSQSDFKAGKCKCRGKKCGRMGYFADKGNRSGRFELKTNSKAPFCIN